MFTFTRKNYEYKKTLLKGLKYFGIFLLPILFNAFVVSYPEWAQLTVGGLFVMIIDWIKRNLV